MDFSKPYFRAHGRGSVGKISGSVVVNKHGGGVLVVASVQIVGKEKVVLLEPVFSVYPTRNKSFRHTN